MSINEQPDPIDVETGARIRIRRKSLGLSQTDLADALGLTFQQVQKYERGFNRVSASTLVRIAAKLKTSVGDLVGETGDGPAPPGVLSKLAAPGAVELLDRYHAMGGEVRKAFLELGRRIG